MSLPSESSGWKQNLIAIALLCIMTAAAFYPLAQAKFLNYDDNIFITDNPRVQSGISMDNIKWAFTNYYYGFYYPVTMLSHMLDCQVFGLRAEGHHMVSVVLHIINSVLLFAALMLMTGYRWRSFFVAALFAIHPLHVESVAWIAERKDVLSALFFFLMLIAYTRYVKKPSLSRYALVFLALLLSLASKAALVTAPFVLLLLDYWPYGRWSPFEEGQGRWGLNRLGRLTIEKIPLFALSVAFSATTFHAQRTVGAMANLAQLSLDKRLANAFVAYLKYVWKMFVPVDLCICYPYHKGLPVAQALAAALLLLCISFYAFYLMRRRPFFFTGWFWFTGVLVPMIGVIQVGLQAMADRYTYISLIGLFILIVWEAGNLAFDKKIGTAAVTISAIVVFALLTVMSNRQSRLWYDSMSVFSHCLRLEPQNNLVANQALANEYIERGDLDMAVTYLKQGLEVRSKHSDILLNLGTVYAKKKKFAEAEECFKKALELAPKDSLVYFNLAGIKSEFGMWEESKSYYKKTLEIDPNHALAHNNLAWLLLEHDPAGWKNASEALKLAKRACELTKNEEPNFLDTLAEAYAASGDLEEAKRTSLKAATLARSQGKEDLAKTIESNLASYLNGKPGGQ